MTALLVATTAGCLGARDFPCPNHSVPFITIESGDGAPHPFELHVADIGFAVNDTARPAPDTLHYDLQDATKGEHEVVVTSDGHVDTVAFAMDCPAGIVSFLISPDGISHYVAHAD